MDRRQFHKTALASVASTTVLPLKTAALPAPAVVSRGTYAFAVAMAQARGHVSKSLLVQGLKVSEKQAAYLMGRLQSRGIITPQGTAINPLFRNGIAPAQHRAKHSRAVGIWPTLSKQIKAATAAYQPMTQAA